MYSRVGRDLLIQVPSLCRNVAAQRVCVATAFSYNSVDREITARSNLFYESNAVERNYFYVMDLRGQLFVENIVRNIATSMKDPKFLDFMYKNLRYNCTGLFPDIPLVTYCGKERNFVTPLDRNSVFVYKDFVRTSDVPSGYYLLYGGTITQPFDPSKLAFSNATGRMYHEVVGHKNLVSTTAQPVYALMHVTITTQHFSDRLVYGDKGSGADDDHQDCLQLEWEMGNPPQKQLFDVKIL